MADPVYVISYVKGKKKIVEMPSASVSAGDIATAVQSYILAHPVSATWDSVTGKPSTFTPATHSHGASDITGTAVLTNDSRLSNSRPASDVSAWAKESVKPTYTAGEIGAEPANTNIQAHISSTHAPATALALSQVLSKNYVGC